MEAEEAVRGASGSPPEIFDGALDVRERAGGSPVRVLRASGTGVCTLVDDLAGAARGPDAVLAWVGVAGLAALGVLEAPVTAAVGVGIAVAGGMRRARD